MPDQEALIHQLDTMWDLETGFIGRLREGHFDPGGVGPLIALLKSIDLAGQECIDLRLVRLLWFIPTFMEWQLERVAKRGGDVVELRRAIGQAQSALLDVFGAP